MPERERKQKPAPKERVEETAEVAAPAKQGEELKEELDDLLDEIDSVLETNAEEFVKVVRTERGRMIPNRTPQLVRFECHTPGVRSYLVKRCADCEQREAVRRVPPQQELEGRTTTRYCKTCNNARSQESRSDFTAEVATIT